MTRTTTSLIALVVLLLLFVVGRSSKNHAKASPLSVTFTGWTNDPTRPPPQPGGLAVCRGATGRCALFWVTNSGPRTQRVWFETFQLEQKVDGQWRRFSPINPEWGGVEGSVWQGNAGCTYAVGLPSGLSSNAIWRLQIDCGPELSPLRSMINRKLGRQIFRRPTEYVTFPSEAVVP